MAKLIYFMPTSLEGHIAEPRLGDAGRGGIITRRTDGGLSPPSSKR